MKLINKGLIIVLLYMLCIVNAFAADWVQLQDDKHAVLMLDKQSISESGKFQKSWVKVDYKALQQNLEYPEKEYNRAKMLWYFNCQEQKSATAQVYQLLNAEQVYSAAIDIKRARFLEPVPETEIDIAMHYVCKYQLAKQARVAQQAAKKTKVAAAQPTDQLSPIKKAEADKSATNKAGDKTKQQSDKVTKSTEKTTTPSEAHAKTDQHNKHTDKNQEKHDKDTTEGDVDWGYTGKEGPAAWGELSPAFAMCQSGQNQSPIDIKQVITAMPKPLKIFQRFQVSEFFNNHGVLEASFKRGNMVVIDKVMYQMKSVRFHAPSEHSIDGKPYPMEAQFFLKEAKGKLAMMAVMFEEGHDNAALKKLWKQMPKASGKKRKIKTKVTAGELMPRNKTYYRFSGSLTSPPCTEGVIWLVMKEPMTISKKQLNKLKKAIQHDNNRPLQALNGRILIEQ